MGIFRYPTYKNQTITDNQAVDIGFFSNIFNNRIKLLGDKKVCITSSRQV